MIRLYFDKSMIDVIIFALTSFQSIKYGTHQPTE